MTACIGFQNWLCQLRLLYRLYWYGRVTFSAEAVSSWVWCCRYHVCMCVRNMFAGNRFNE